ncbi:MAG: hypothetical protein HXY34_06855 [Candidatus Thorarchaeota archaeon]|nr:hypothetical protein [Candidatus Thorarchaeota archaeon]
MDQYDVLMRLLDAEAFSPETAIPVPELDTDERLRWALLNLFAMPGVSQTADGRYFLGPVSAELVKDFRAMEQRAEKRRHEQ